mgnify:CR=1 FL=1
MLTSFGKRNIGEFFQQKARITTTILAFLIKYFYCIINSNSSLYPDSVFPFAPSHHFR